MSGMLVRQSFWQGHHVPQALGKEMIMAIQTTEFNMDKVDQFIKQGTKVFFEYHCQETHDSADADLWYRSHQKVVVGECDNLKEFGDLTFRERLEGCCPLVYLILFSDGFEGNAFEDELLDSEDQYDRPQPPKPRY